MPEARRSKRHSRRRGPVWRRALGVLRRFLWPRVEVAPSSAYPEPPQKWKPMAFVVILVVAALALVGIIMGESGPSEQEQHQE